MKTQNKQHGATIMENMLVLAIGTAIAFPTFSMAGKSFKQLTQMNDVEVGQVAMEQNCNEIDSRYLLIDEHTKKDRNDDNDAAPLSLCGKGGPK
jgi:hypothetical protein